MPMRTCLWFDGNAEDAVDYYLAIFKDAKKTSHTTYGPDMPMKEGTTLTIEFELLGTPFLALNAGDDFSFTPAVSFMIPCADQAEVDHYWDHLVEGGTTMACGWLTDRFGITWQVIPNRLGELLSDPDAERVARTVKAMMQMVKLDVAQLEAAADGR